LSCGSHIDAIPKNSDNNSLLSGDLGKLVQTPVETAIHHYDPVIYLLVGLGASLDIGIKQSYERPWSEKASLLEAVEAIIKNTNTELESSRQPAELGLWMSTRQISPSGKAWITKSNQAVKVFEKKANKRQEDSGHVNKYTGMKDYLEEVLGLLKEKKAKTWNQLHPDAEKKKDDDKEKQEKPANRSASGHHAGGRASPTGEGSPLRRAL